MSSCKSAYRANLNFELVSTRQFFKMWHYSKYVRDGSNVLDLGAGYMDVGKMLKDNHLNANYYPIDIEYRRRKGIDDNFVLVDFEVDKLADKIPNINYDLVIMSELLQNLDKTTGKKLLREVYDLPGSGLICALFRTGKYIENDSNDRRKFWEGWTKPEFLDTIKTIGFRIINIFGISYKNSNMLPELDFKNYGVIYDKLREFFPDAISRCLLGIDCVDECKHIMVDMER